MGKMLLLSFENSEDGEYGIALIKFKQWSVSYNSDHCLFSFLTPKRYSQFSKGNHFIITTSLNCL